MAYIIVSVRVRALKTALFNSLINRRFFLQALQERGEALGQLEERTTRMMTEAEVFSHNSHQIMLKYKDKKWYQL